LVFNFFRRVKGAWLKGTALLIMGLAALMTLSACSQEKIKDINGMWFARYEWNGIPSVIVLINVGEFGVFMKGSDVSSDRDLCRYFYKVVDLTVSEIYLDKGTGKNHCVDHPPFMLERSGLNTLKYTFKEGEDSLEVELNSLMRPLQEDELLPKGKGADFNGIKVGMEKAEVAKRLEGYKQTINAKHRNTPETYFFVNETKKSSVAVAYSDRNPPRVIAIALDETEKLYTYTEVADLLNEYGFPVGDSLYAYDLQGRKVSSKEEAQAECSQQDPLLLKAFRGVITFSFPTPDGSSYDLPLHQKCNLIGVEVSPSPDDSALIKGIKIRFADRDMVGDFHWRNQGSRMNKNIVALYQELAARSRQLAEEVKSKP